MDILVYDYIIEGLSAYNDSWDENYGNVITNYPTIETTYPYTVVEEIRNVVTPKYKSRYDKVSSVSYRVDIYAKTKGNIDKQKIAREISQKIDKFFTEYVGLMQTSWNVSELENDSSIYHIIVVYGGHLHENRRKII